MAEDDEDDPQWTLENLTYGGHEAGAYPNAVTTCRLTREYHAKWIRSTIGPRHERLNASNMPAWLVERFGVDPDVMDWNEFMLCVSEQYIIMSNLNKFLVKHDLAQRSAEHEMQQECARLIYNVHTLFVEMTRLIRNCNTDRDCRLMFSPQLQDDAAFEQDCSNVVDHDEAKNTTFQNAFITLTRILQAMEFRRASGKFFKRIITKSGFHTNAFEEAMTIAEFIAKHSAHGVNFKLWKCVTNPTSNYEHLIKYMKERALPEAPDLEEDCHLRSYEGDSVGRGAGIYDCAADMFFPYIVRDDWSALADLAVRVRTRMNPRYRCSAPRDAAVCVVHLACAFPYDIWGELCRLADEQVGTVWRNADAFECTNPSDEIDCAELTSRLVAELPAPHTDEEKLPPVIGQTWQLVNATIEFPPADEDWEELTLPELLDFLLPHLGEGLVHVTEQVELALASSCVLHMNSFVALDTAQGRWVYVPLETPGFRRRAVVPQDIASLQLPGRIDGRSFLKCAASGRYFRPNSGRTWLECNADEIDHIYICQKFGVHDRFMIYACKGRLFFEVGEFDSMEITLFFEGVGGCGKTTIMKAEQAFWPAHLRGILSPNMQPQFGMSSVCKAKVVFCNEVSADLNIVQEEWQTACSGEWGSYAVKFDDPITMKWIAHFFWIGNAFPTRFKNLQGQVSRRLAGVLMSFPVTPRDGSIIKKILEKLGALQRKQVLAYFEFIQIHGSTDPMSVPDKLPPAFAEYYRKGRRATDPIEDFLSEGTFVTLDPTKKMLMSDFKELYTQYRIKYDLGKALRWSEASYRTPFNERGLFVRREESVWIDGTEHRNVDIILGIGPVDE